MIKRSTNINFSTYTLYSDYSSSMSDDDSFNSEEEKNDFLFSPLDHFTQLFKVQKFNETECTRFLPFTDNDYDFASLNSPIFPSYTQKMRSVACLFVMCSQPHSYFDSETSSYGKMPTLFLWKNINNIVPSNFLNEVQNYFHEKYEKLKYPIRYFFQVSPDEEQLFKTKVVRRDIPDGRILFHYIGYGFPTIKTKIYGYERRNNTFVKFPIKKLFENIKTPSWFIFDCDNAESALREIEKSAAACKEVKTKGYSYDWDDWICFCATGKNEKLPADPHLPKDFLTSCLLTPTKLAVLCHLLQFYRTNLIAPNWSMNDLESPLFVDEVNGVQTEFHKSLNEALESITDAIAAESLPYELYNKLFKTDNITTKLFQRFLLAQFLLKKHQIHPKCHPHIPDLSSHSLWQQWHEMIDVAVISSTSRCFVCEIFTRACMSFTNLTESGLYDEIPVSYLTILSHSPSNKEIKSKAAMMLASYAAQSETNRIKISRYVSFDNLFHNLLSNVFESDPSAMHSLCYLILVILNENKDFALLNQNNNKNVSNLTKLLFSDSISEGTRTFISAIISTLVPINDQIKQSAISEEFIIQLKELLENSGPELSLWVLILQRRLFDGYGLNLATFYNNGIHIQTGSFCLHFSPEVRAAAMATLPCLLHPNSDIINMHLFGFALLSGFDGSYFVRYNFVLFLSRFLSIYSNKISGHVPIGFLAHQLFGCVVGTWAGLEGSVLVSLGEIISNFDKLTSLITQIMKTKDAIQRFIGIGLFLAEYLSDDPHPSVKEAATQLANLNAERSGLRKKITKSRDSYSVPCHGSSLTRCIEMLPANKAAKKKADSNEEEEEYNELRQATCESGGDALYKSCMSQIVRSGCWEEDVNIQLAKRPYKTTKIIHPEECLCRNIFNCKPTSIAYDSMSRDCVIGFENGTMRYISKDIPNDFTEIKLTSKITSLEVTSVDGQTYAIAGTDDGCCHIWDGLSKFPQQCFRTDGLPKMKVPQLVSVLNNKPFVLTARGNCGSLKLWDIKAQRLVNEWVATQNNKDNIITAMAVDPVTSQCYLGHSTGLIALVDVRSEEIQKIPDFNSCGVPERIITIKGNVSSTKQIYSATENGNISMWSNFQTSIVPFMRLDSCKISSIDFHITQPLICISTNQSKPTVLTSNGKFVSKLNECSPESLVGFHPSLPIVGACTKDGKFYEYDLSHSI